MNPCQTRPSHGTANGASRKENFRKEEKSRKIVKKERRHFEFCYFHFSHTIYKPSLSVKSFITNSLCFLSFSASMRLCKSSPSAVWWCARSVIQYEMSVKTEKKRVARQATTSLFVSRTALHRAGVKQLYGLRLVTAARDTLLTSRGSWMFSFLR